MTGPSVPEINQGQSHEAQATRWQEVSRFIQGVPGVEGLTSLIRNPKDGIQFPRMGTAAKATAVLVVAGVATLSTLPFFDRVTSGNINLGPQPAAAQEFSKESASRLIEASGAVTTTLALIDMTEQEQKDHPVDVRGKGYVKDSTGSVLVQYRLNADGSVDRSRLNSDSQYEAYQSYATNTKVENPQAFSLQQNGKLAIAGGSDALTLQQAQLGINFNFDSDPNNFVDLSGKFADRSGLITAIIPVPEANKYLITVNSFEKKTSIYIMTVGNSAETTTIMQTNLTDGIAKGLTSAGYDSSKGLLRAYSTGSADITSGLLEYEINIQTGQTKVTRKFPDVATGFLYGLFVENDAQGNPKTVYANSPFNNQIYIFDVVNNTYKVIDVSLWGYKNGIDDFNGMELYVITKKGDVFTAAGGYASKRGGGGPVVTAWHDGADPVADPSSLNLQVIEPTDQLHPLSGIDQKNFDSSLIYKSQYGTWVNTPNLGEIFIPNDADGRISKSERHFPNRRAERAATRGRAYLPALGKNFNNGW